MISLGRKAVGRPKRHSLTTSSTDFSYDNRYSPSSKEFVTLSKFPSSVPRRHSPSGLSPPVMMSEAATTTTTTGGVQKEWSKSAVPTWFILCQHLFRLPPMPSLRWSIDRPVPNKGFRRRVWRGTETQSKSSRFFLTPFLTKNRHDYHTDRSAKQRGKFIRSGDLQTPGVEFQTPRRSATSKRRLWEKCTTWATSNSSHVCRSELRW